MSRWKKLGLVVAGYGLALVVSSIVVAVYDRRFTPADNQAMGGMIAGGEMMLGAGVFAMVALLPTGLALWYLRRSRPFWSVFSGAGLVFATGGLVAVLAPFVHRWRAGHPLALDLLGLFGIVQMLGSPIWIGGFLVFAILAPAPDLRRRMLIAGAIEILIAGCGVLHFLSPAPPF